MRNILKATTLENKFPLFTVENGCIVSKDADITVAFRVELPELFTVTAAEYEAIHSAWNKAVKVLPDYSIVHKQDWFITWAAPVPSPPHPTFTCSSDPAHNVGGVSLTLQLGKLRFLEGFTACRSQRLSLKSPA